MATTTRPLRRKNARRKARRRAVRAALCVIVLATAAAAAFFMPQRLRVPPLFYHAPPATVDVPAPPFIPGSTDVGNPDAPVSVQRERKRGVPFTIITGGTLQTRRSPRREGVPDFVTQARAQAGLNGTFFADAALAGTDNVLIGPTLCGNEQRVTRGPYDAGPLLAGRPLVISSPTQTRIVPYNPRTMDTDAGVRSLLPGATDAFLGGVWLVRDGKPADADRVATFGVHDAFDPRRRAFFALAQDGSPVLGATTGVTDSVHLATALAAAGLRDAVLMDSGFSTSLVNGKTILVTGHTSAHLPSRPVPHALLLFAPPTSNPDAPLFGSDAPTFERPVALLDLLLPPDLDGGVPVYGANVKRFAVLAGRQRGVQSAGRVQ